MAAKKYTELTQAQNFTVTVGPKTTVINTGGTDVFVTTQDDATELETLEPRIREIVLQSMYCIKPGENMAFSAGSYALSFGLPVSCSAVLVA